MSIATSNIRPDLDTYQDLARLIVLRSLAGQDQTLTEWRLLEMLAGSGEEPGRAESSTLEGKYGLGRQLNHHYCRFTRRRFHPSEADQDPGVF